jgi:hypothetical protein
MVHVRTNEPDGIFVTLIFLLSSFDAANYIYFLSI